MDSSLRRTDAGDTSERLRSMSYVSSIHGNIVARDLKQSGRQYQRRHRFRIEFKFSTRISRMAGCVYRLSRCHTSTSAERLSEQRWISNESLHNFSSMFPFSGHAGFGDFTLFFRRGRLRMVYNFKTLLLELLFYPSDLLVCHVLVRARVPINWRRTLPKLVFFILLLHKILPSKDSCLWDVFLEITVITRLKEWTQLS